MASLKGKTLFISGASRGIGLAIALRAARDGANVAIAAKTAEPHPRLKGTIYTAADEVRVAGGKALPLVVDVRDEGAVAAAIDTTATTFGGIDVLVNNASAINLSPTTATDMKRFDLMHQINTRGTFMVSQKGAPNLAKAGNPHVLAWRRRHPRSGTFVGLANMSGAAQLVDADTVTGYGSFLPVLASDGRPEFRADRLLLPGYGFAWFAEP